MSHSLTRSFSLEDKVTLKAFTFFSFHKTASLKFNEASLFPEAFCLPFSLLKNLSLNFIMPRIGLSESLVLLVAVLHGVGVTVIYSLPNSVSLGEDTTDKTEPKKFEGKLLHESYL